MGNATLLSTMRVLNILIIISCVFCACKENSNEELGSKKRQFLAEISFKREIPSDSHTYSFDKAKEKQLGLKSIESGFDSAQIRLWVDFALYKGRELYMIKHENGSWSADVYKMMVERVDNLDKEIITSRTVKSVTPKLGWDLFVDSMLILDIETLPNMSDIPGLVDGWDDGVDYNIEIATKYRYRYYSYHLPEEFQDNYWQARNMVRIVNLIRRELNK
ncbi:MAG TPA: hypothetical protein VGD26_12295 [Chitinophagaceae bacterium]